MSAAEALFQLSKMMRNHCQNEQINKCHDASSWFNGHVALDTLDVSFDPKHVAAYFSVKEAEVENLANSANLEIGVKKNITAFEQVLSHEAFHVYQILRYSIVANLSLAQRSVGLLKFDYISRNVAENKKYSMGDRLLDKTPISYNSQNFSVTAIYNTDLKEVEEKIFQADRNSPYTILEIIEGAAISFQLLATRDPLAEAVQNLRPIYKRVWEDYCEVSQIDKHNIEQVATLRTIHVFATDIFLKFFDIHFKDTCEFSNFINVSSSYMNKIYDYQVEFNNALIREKRLTEALAFQSEAHEREKLILDFCGRLPYESQEKLYVLIRLYSDLFKRLALVGAEARSRPSNNKNRAINKWLEKTFPYWSSDFCLPCVLCNYSEGIKFAFIWKELSGIRFIDDTRSQIISVGEENMILNLVRRIEKYLEDNNDENYCCSEHGFISKHTTTFKTCDKVGSLDSLFRFHFNRSISMVVNNG